MALKEGIIHLRKKVRLQQKVPLYPTWHYGNPPKPNSKTLSLPIVIPVGRNSASTAWEGPITGDHYTRLAQTPQTQHKPLSELQSHEHIHRFILDLAQYSTLWRKKGGKKGKKCALSTHVIYHKIIKNNIQK